MHTNEKSIVQASVVKVSNGAVREDKEPVVIERALTIYLNDEEFVTMICSPGLEKELITGFLCSEGVITRPQDLVNISLDLTQGLAWVETAQKRFLSEKLFLKRYLTSCCGKGRSSFYFANDARIAQQITSDLQINMNQVSQYAEMLEQSSELFRLTGGVHGGALASNGGFDYYANDIGRHNVLDKLYGQAFLAGESLNRKVLVFSGRISSEILLKTAKMGCPILVARSAPTDLALNLADELGLTVVGFARQDRMNIYTHRERILI